MFFASPHAHDDTRTTPRLLLPPPSPPQVCRPCARLYPLLSEAPAPSLPSLDTEYTGRGLALLKRTENEGMDFAAHNVTLSWMAAQGKLR